MPKSIQVAFDIPAGARAQNAEWLTNDFSATDLGKLRFNIVVSSDAVVEYTVNSGTNWIKLNSGNNILANCSFGFDVYLRAGDFINFRTPTVGGTTVILGRLDKITDEG